MYLSRVTVSSAHLEEFSKIFQYNHYQLHQLLWKLFQDKPEKKRDFLFRQDSYKGLPVFYILSQSKPNQTISTLKVETKEFNLQLKAGDKLRFSLRANPVEQITKARIDEEQKLLRVERQKKGLKDKQILPMKRVRHDVVMHLKKTLSLAERELYSQSELEQQAGKTWLEKKAKKNGFKLLSVTAEGYQQHHFKKRGIKISTLDFQGVLEVTDPDLFIEKAFYVQKNSEIEPKVGGLGGAKAFGCGLLMIARI